MFKFTLQAGLQIFCDNFANIAIIFRTRLLENKDKKGTSLPKPKVVKRVVPSASGHVINTPASGHSGHAASLSPGQSSYSGLGPGRGHRPQSPMSRPSHPASSSLSPASNSISQQNSSLHPAAPQSRPASFTNSSSSRPAPAPSRPPVNTEIMKRPLRYLSLHSSLRISNFGALVLSFYILFCFQGTSDSHLSHKTLQEARAHL